jgi:hypothetical protein
MDRPLVALRGIALGIALLSAALYAAWGMSLGGREVYLADGLRSIQQRESLIEGRRLLFRSMEVTQDIIDHLIEGCLSLTDAVAAFRDEIESRPPFLQPPIYFHEWNLDPEERYRLRLLFRIKNQLEGDPRREEVLMRLQAELDVYRAARARSDIPETPKWQAVAVSH